MDNYFKMYFFIIEAFLFLYLLTKLLVVKIYKHKCFTSAGLCYLFGIFFMCLFGLLSIMPFIINDKYNIIIQAKSFLYITGIIYLQIYFYKMSKSLGFENSITEAKRNTRTIKIIKNNMYILSAVLFMIETLCVPIFSNSKCCIRFYEFIPVICLTIFIIYQISLSLKIKNGFVIRPWITYSVITFMFLTVRWFIGNFVIDNYVIPSMIGVVLRICQLFSLGYIAFFRKDELEVSLV